MVYDPGLENTCFAFSEMEFKINCCQPSFHASKIIHTLARRVGLGEGLDAGMLPSLMLPSLERERFGEGDVMVCVLMNAVG